MDWQSLAIPLVVVVGVAGIVWSYRRADSILHAWAARNCYRILWAERRAMRRGPFVWTTGKGQVVFRVSVDVGEGQPRLGYVRCGSLSFGVMSDQAEVRWDREPTHRPGFPVVMR